jgi:hypothetical protein
MRNKFRQATDKAKKKYLESKQDEIIEFQRTGLHVHKDRGETEFRTLALKNLMGN